MNNGGPPRNCDDVANNPSQRCNNFGTDGRLANIACPVACDTCDCQDDSGWAYLTTNNNIRGCINIAVNPGMRCSEIGIDSTPATIGCPATCGTCFDDGGSATTDSPTPGPTEPEFNNNEPPPTPAPSASPSESFEPTIFTVCQDDLTVAAREAMLLTLVSDISAQSLIQNSGTNENLAFRWLVDDDEARVCPEDTVDVVQRYVLALLYFSTNGDDWNECNAASASDAAGCASLAERYLSAANVCDWFGSECDDDVNLSEISIGKCLV